MATPDSGRLPRPSDDDDDGFLFRIPDLDRAQSDNARVTRPPSPGAERSLPSAPSALPSGADAMPLPPKPAVARPPSATSSANDGSERSPRSAQDSATPSQPSEPVSRNAERSPSPTTHEPVEAAATGGTADERPASRPVQVGEPDDLLTRETARGEVMPAVTATASVGLLDRMTSWPALAALGLLTAFVVGYVAISRPTPSRNNQETAQDLSLDLGQPELLAGDPYAVGDGSAADLLAMDDPDQAANRFSRSGGIPKAATPASSEVAPARPAEIIAARSAREPGGADRPASSMLGSSRPATVSEGQFEIGGADLDREMPPLGRVEQVSNSQQSPRDPSPSRAASGGGGARTASLGSEFPVTDPATFRYDDRVRFPASPNATASAHGATQPAVGRMAERDSEPLVPDWSIR